MSGRLSGLKDAIKVERQLLRPEPVPQTEPSLKAVSLKARARAGKHALVGYFSADMTTEINVIAKQRRTTVQAILGEAIDLWMEANGKNRFGER